MASATDVVDVEQLPLRGGRMKTTFFFRNGSHRVVYHDRDERPEPPTSLEPGAYSYPRERTPEEFQRELDKNIADVVRESRGRLR